MTPREFCINRPSIAYASCLGGVEIKKITDFSVYAVSGAWCAKKHYHCVRLYESTSGRIYFVIAGQRIYLDECIAM